MCSTCHNNHIITTKCSKLSLSSSNSDARYKLCLLVSHTVALYILLALPSCHGSEAEPSPRNLDSRWWWADIDQWNNMGKIMLGEDPLLLSGHHEGDILLSPPIARSDHNVNSFAEEKNAIADESALWPGGVVPYEFSAGYDVLPMERFLITRAMRDMESKSCVRFVKRTHEHDFVKIVFDTYKCYSNIGRRGGEQVLSLGIFCVMYFDRGNVYHELLHVLGFYHEHTRPDRDEFIDVMWGNIKSEAVKNFRKRDYNTVDNLQMPYDIDSVMHYSPHAFSKFYYMLPTIVSHDRGIFFTRSRWPSKIDYAKLNKLYRCHNRRFSHRRPQIFRNRII